jgi:hypothetical protein
VTDTRPAFTFVSVNDVLSPHQDASSTVNAPRVAFSVTAPRDDIAVALMAGALLALLVKLRGASCLTHVGREGAPARLAGRPCEDRSAAAGVCRVRACVAARPYWEREARWTLARSRRARVVAPGRTAVGVVLDSPVRRTEEIACHEAEAPRRAVATEVHAPVHHRIGRTAASRVRAGVGTGARIRSVGTGVASRAAGPEREAIADAADDKTERHHADWIPFAVHFDRLRKHRTYQTTGSRRHPGCGRSPSPTGATQPRQKCHDAGDDGPWQRVGDPSDPDSENVGPGEFRTPLPNPPPAERGEGTRRNNFVHRGEAQLRPDSPRRAGGGDQKEQFRASG